MSRSRIRIDEAPFDPVRELCAFENAAGGGPDAGAVVSFLGKVRREAGENPVRALFLEHYPGMTERSIAGLVAQARARWAIGDCLVIHRVGEMAPGAAIVFVCVSAAHRRAAFEAADFLMDGLKTKALFWKKEVREKGEAWIEPRAEDYQDAERWSGGGRPGHKDARDEDVTR